MGTDPAVCARRGRRDDLAAGRGCVACNEIALFRSPWQQGVFWLQSCSEERLVIDASYLRDGAPASVVLHPMRYLCSSAVAAKLLPLQGGGWEGDGCNSAQLPPPSPPER